MQIRRGIAVLLVGCASLAGCQLLAPTPKGVSPLRPLQPSPETVGLEIFSARFAPDDQSVNVDLWQEVDEQQIPIDTRRQLAQHGFRAGVIGPQPPAELAKLLKIVEKAIPAASQGQQTVDQLMTEPTVTMRAIFTRAGWRNEVIASKTYEQLPLLERDGDAVRGRTYPKADGRFILKAYPQADGHVRLEATPELQYGDPRQHWSASDGVLRPEASRPQKTFDRLKLDVPLAPGQMLLITCLPERKGSVGYWFFMEAQDERYSQKLLVVRIAQATGDSSFTETPLAEKLEDLISRP